MKKVTEVWKKANIMLNFKKEDLSKDRLFSLSLISGKVMEQVFVEASSRSRKDRKMAKIFV